ncbi:MAG: hypothetical protein HRU19_22030 [Pseudobacteriovorax sp.]|nr:hypothetical protein [Pseudobacteriovorax sp.]
MKLITLVSLPILLLAACDSEDSTSSSATPTPSAGTLYVNITPTASTAGADLRAVDASQFRNKSITSGPPEELRLYITSMSLANSSGEGGETPIFVDEDGAELVIRDGGIDISSLFTQIGCIASDGTVLSEDCPCGLDANNEPISKESDPAEPSVEWCPEVDTAAGDTPASGVVNVEQAGSYDLLKVSYLSTAKMRGCVTGNFAGNDATVDDPITGVQTYCTRTGYDTPTMNSTGTSYNASDFQGNTATLMDVAMDVHSRQELNLEFPIQGGVTIGGDSEDSPKITLLVDTNRMLRFDNGKRETSACDGSTFNESSNVWAPYFFNDILGSSSFVFVGQVGEVQGYSWSTLVESASDQATAESNSLTCQNSEFCIYVNGWLTIIKQADGTPYLNNFLPDDDGALTVLKGGNYAADGVAIDEFVVNSSSSWDINYTLGSQLDGVVKGFDPTTAVGSSQDVNFLVDAADAGEWSYGEVTFTRVQ